MWPFKKREEKATSVNYDENLVPPVEMLNDGSSSLEEFCSVGEGFTYNLLINRAGLKAHDKVLDVGCGIGQKARVLASYLNNDGSYDGFDVLKSAIEWCQEHYGQYPNFKFQHTDILNSHYNQEGKIKSSEFIFPYPDHCFDLVFLSSVFTHMLPKDMEHYTSEIYRVLKTDGRCLVTFFLLNETSRSNMDKETCKIKIPHIYETAECQIADLENPEMIVAHDEDRVRHLFLSNNLGICEIAYGDWCGRKELLGCLQDYVIAVS